MEKVRSLPPLHSGRSVSTIPLEVACIVLLILTPLSYLPLNRNIAAHLATPPTNGISIIAALLLAFCAQSQLATIYYLWACPPFKRYGEVVPKPPHRIDYINLAQFVAQWICAVGFLLFLLQIRSHTRPSLSSDPDFNQAPPPVVSDTSHPSTKTVMILLTLHASLSLFWAWFAGTPSRDWLDLNFVGIMSVQQYIVNPIMTILVAVAMGLQIDTTRNTQGTSPFTRLAVTLQAFVFVALAVSWPARFRVPENLGGTGWLWWIGEWYPLVGWACVNNGILGVGLTISAFFAGTGRRESITNVGGERVALLGT